MQVFAKTGHSKAVLEGWHICKISLYARSAYMQDRLIRKIGLYARSAYMQVYTVSSYSIIMFR